MHRMCLLFCNQNHNEYYSVWFQPNDFQNLWVQNEWSGWEKRSNKFELMEVRSECELKKVIRTREICSQYLIVISGYHQHHCPPLHLLHRQKSFPHKILLHCLWYFAEALIKEQEKTKFNVCEERENFISSNATSEKAEKSKIRNLRKKDDLTIHWMLFQWIQTGSMWH